MAQATLPPLSFLPFCGSSPGEIVFPERALFLQTGKRYLPFPSHAPRAQSHAPPHPNPRVWSRRMRLHLLNPVTRQLQTLSHALYPLSPTPEPPNGNAGEITDHAGMRHKPAHAEQDDREDVPLVPLHAGFHRCPAQKGPHTHPQPSTLNLCHSNLSSCFAKVNSRRNPSTYHLLLAITKEHVEELARELTFSKRLCQHFQ